MLKKKHAAKPSVTKKDLTANLRFTFDCIQSTLKCHFIKDLYLISFSPIYGHRIRTYIQNTVSSQHDYTDINMFLATCTMLFGILNVIKD